MSPGPSSALPAAPLPRIVEPFKMVDQRSLLDGRIALAQLPRLEDLVLDREGDLRVKLVFGKDEEGISHIDGKLATCLEMQCQRCLEPIMVEVAAEFRLGLARSEAAAEQLPRYYDPVLVQDAELDLWQLLEEELLLSLPLVPYHAPEQCAIDEQYRRQDEMPAADKPNPFAVLEQLKKRD